MTGFLSRDLIKSANATRRVKLQQDLAAYDVTGWRPSMRLQFPGLYYQRVMRDVEFLYSAGRPRLANIRRAYLKLIGMFLGISIPPGTFDGGLSIPHYGSVIVNDKVRAGRFCRIHSGTNLGETSDGAPTLGDGVYIGPGAVLYGPISIGAGAVIGANSVVNQDVPPSTLAAGSPARLMRHNNPPDVMPSWIQANLLRIVDRQAGLKVDTTAQNGEG
ncbi:serine acetyltransferase [Williamsia muralis]|uniref:Serine acetyltransferase n=2 Tax=Williamsia marianensis TaxID=85044 RepID=A0A2G3PHR9_WILMA|nr:serine acetyltransferase [Williamsia marianensis]